MGDFGVKVALPGVDTATASDAQLLFSSSWPNIKIFKNLPFLNITIDSTGNANNFAQLYNHGLSFVPAVIPYGKAFFSTSSDTADINRQNILADNQNLYVLTQGAGPVSFSSRVSILYLDIETPFTAPITNNGDNNVARADTNFGIKLSKVGKDIKSNDMRDFILHSSTRSPMIHAVVPGQIPASQSGFNTFSYTHDLSYNPIFFAFIQEPGIGTLSSTTPYVLLNGYAGLSTVGNTISITGPSISKVSIIILKDPFNITDNIINVSL